MLTQEARPEAAPLPASAPVRRRAAVLYPRGQKTGGPEAVHQLVDELRRQGVEAFVCPHPSTVANPRVPAFERYEAPELRFEDLRSDDVLLGAEIYVRELLRAPVRQRVVWWLSVDNASPFLFTMRLRDPLRRHEALADGPSKLLFRLAREAWWRSRLRKHAAIAHLAQSEYAKRFVEHWTGGSAPLVSDYVVHTAARPGIERVRRRIAYNPAKGADLVEQVRAALPEFEFLPLVGLDAAGLADALASSAVYLDVGHHPGKDRIPREAALHGCAVVVAGRGSARLDEDLPLPAAHKVPIGPGFAEDCARLLHAIADERDAVVRAQDGLRVAVHSERETFSREVAAFRQRFLEQG